MKLGMAKFQKDEVVCMQEHSNPMGCQRHVHFKVVFTMLICGVTIFCALKEATAKAACDCAIL